MRTLRKNQTPLKYSLQIAEIPEFETLYYEDDEGNKYPTGIKPTGKQKLSTANLLNFLQVSA